MFCVSGQVKKYIGFLVFVFVLMLTTEASAEPWLSNRYAQNCAACHSPGRYNRPAKKRRCTLSCQACHVNPNGGGLRSQYGKWNQQRWLKSFYSKKHLGNKKLPMPSHHQPYMKKSKTILGGYKGPKSKKAYRKKILLSTAKVTTKDSDYNRFTDEDWHIDVDKKKFLSRIPSVDPYWLKRKNVILAGADFRYFYGSFESETTGGSAPGKREVDFDSLMAVDLGIRLKPVREHVSLVFEQRTLDRGDANLIQSLDTTKTRSAYLLVDDLMYNSWFMAGLYRPMFGLYNPDHNSLSSKLSGFNQFTTFKSFGFGTAPNVPFFNVHMITSSDKTALGSNFFPSDSGSAGSSVDQTGFNVNVGLRFIVNSLNVKASYWNSKTDERSSLSTDKSTKEMYAGTAGAKFGRFILNAEYLNWRTENPTTKAQNSGSVITVDSKVQVWRETYVSLNYAQANTSVKGVKGDSKELSLGVKGYLYAGVKPEIIFSMREDNDTNNNIKVESTAAMAQLHFFF